LCLLVELCSCAYSFSPDPSGAVTAVTVAPSANATQLVEAGMILDRHLEKTVSELGLLAEGGKGARIACTVVSARRERTSVSSLLETDRYRLVITVRAVLMDSSGRTSWEGTFTDWGTFLEGETDEAALDEACGRVAARVAHALASMNP